MTYDEARSKVRQFPTETNWDSYGAEPTSQRAMVSAILMLHAMEAAGLPCPFPVPTVSGGIEFEWFDEDHSDYHIAVPA